MWATRQESWLNITSTLWAESSENFALYCILVIWSNTKACFKCAKWAGDNPGNTDTLNSFERENIYRPWPIYLWLLRKGFCRRLIPTISNGRIGLGAFQQNLIQSVNKRAAKASLQFALMLHKILSVPMELYGNKFIFWIKLLLRNSNFAWHKYQLLINISSRM